MSKTRIGIAFLGAAGLAVSALMFTPPSASADPQQNQEFYTGQGNWYLGQPAEAAFGGYDPSGEQIGHIWTPAAPYKCLNMDISGTYMDGHDQTVILWDCGNDINEDWVQWNNKDIANSWSFSTIAHGYGIGYDPQFMDGHYGGDRTLVSADSWYGGDSQKWTIGWESQLQSVGSPGECLDDQNWGTANTTPMQLWQCVF